MPLHLRAVGDKAGAYGAAFGAGACATLAGYLHDVGKTTRAFQAYIGDNGPRAPHSAAGARIAGGLFPGDPFNQAYARLAAFAIAGHHAGLPDHDQLQRRLEEVDLAGLGAWQDLTPPLPADIKAILPGAGSRNSIGYKFAFLGRMIFSCLVDADFTETERFYAAAAGQTVDRGGHAPLTILRDRLDRHLARFSASTGTLNGHRAEILAHARGKAALPPGLFTMTVPTGGGKTLASLAFALDHAIAHGLTRVIYVIPYTSIIEQTAAIFRTALADANGDAPDLLEHHGTVDWDQPATAVERDAQAKLRRASENWDVPVVVTTAVQFFESLHANRTSRCRKLHNIANSVVVLDEAQTLPLALLRPCVAAIGELTGSYNASIVLCTATQPALRVQDHFPGGLDIPKERELAPDPTALYQALKRVTVENVGTVDDAEIVDRFAAQDRMLCIVNSRKHAQSLFGLIADMDGARHLTTLMCPAHRRTVLAAVRADLAAGRPIRLVSTSLIEAGVDVDFPEVWRAAAGLDSIAQAAGRANREGGPVPGRVVIFESCDHPTPAMFGHQTAALRAVLREEPDDPLGLPALNTYFRELYHSKSDRMDAGLVANTIYPILASLEGSCGVDLRPRPDYDRIATAFGMIDDEGRPVIVPWRGGEQVGELDRLLATLAAAPLPPAATLRRLQHFMVSIPEAAYRAMLAVKAVQPVAGHHYSDRFMLVQEVGLYSADTGLALDPFGNGAWSGLF